MTSSRVFSFDVHNIDYLFVLCRVANFEIVDLGRNFFHFFEIFDLFFSSSECSSSKTGWSPISKFLSSFDRLTLSTLAPGLDFNTACSRSQRFALLFVELNLVSGFSRELKSEELVADDLGTRPSRRASVQLESGSAARYPGIPEELERSRPARRPDSVG